MSRSTPYYQVFVTVQTCGDLQDIRPLVEGQPSTEFPLQTAFVPSNVNSYRCSPDCPIKSLSLYNQTNRRL